MQTMDKTVKWPAMVVLRPVWAANYDR